MATSPLCSSCQEAFSRPVPLCYTVSRSQVQQSESCPMCTQIQLLLSRNTNRSIKSPGFGKMLKGLVGRKQRDFKDPDWIDIQFHHEDHRFSDTIEKAVRETSPDGTSAWLRHLPYELVKARWAELHMSSSAFGSYKFQLAVKGAVPGLPPPPDFIPTVLLPENLFVTFKTIQLWLTTCSTKHQGCNQPPDRAKMPKRLLDIISHTSGIRLMECVRPERYIALSYVWGSDTSQHLTTTRATLDTHKNGIPLSRLPHTIRDAVTLARQLHAPDGSPIRYLWVDALCILQDNDAPEKKTELARMGDVYSNSCLTLAVASAEHCDAGFLRDAAEPLAVSREQHAEYTICIPGYRYKDHGPATVYLNPSQDGQRYTPHIRRIFEGEELHTRGWTFQELMLSRRVLIYSGIQPYWRCRCAKWSCGDPGMDEYLERTELHDLLGGVTKSSLEGGGFAWVKTPPAWEDTQSVQVGSEAAQRERVTAAPGSSTPVESGGVVDSRKRETGILQSSAWLAEVENFSRRRLTKETDRLLALHALRMREEARLNAINRDEDVGYAAGIFRVTASVGLLWAAVGNLIFPSDPPQTRGPGRPSWSWTSFRGPIEHPITKAPPQTIRPQDQFEIVSWPEADNHGNVLPNSQTAMVLHGVIKDVVIPETDVANSTHGREIECYDAKTASWISSNPLSRSEDEQLYKMGTIVFDEYQTNGKDYRDFNGKTTTKLSILCICFAGLEEQLKIKKTIGGDRDREVIWHGPKGCTAFGLVVVPEKPGAVMEVVDREGEGGRFSIRGLFSHKGKEVQQPVADFGPERPLRCRRIGLFCGSPTSSRFLEGGRARMIELID